jgi:DNA-binding NarL/FixJ family response regulator
MEVVGATDSGMDAVSLVCTARPHVVITELDLSSLSGVGLIQRLRQGEGATPPRVIAFTLGVDDEMLTRIIHAGVNGVLAESATRHEVVAAVRAAAQGHMSLAPQLAQRLIDWFRLNNGHFDEGLGRLAGSLTSREREVLRLMARGRTMEAVARKLCIEMTTVRTHVYRMRTKLDIHDRAQLVAFAYRAGLMRTAGSSRPGRHGRVVTAGRAAPPPAASRRTAGGAGGSRPAVRRSPRRPRRSSPRCALRCWRSRRGAIGPTAPTPGVPRCSS